MTDDVGAVVGVAAVVDVATAVAALDVDVFADAVLDDAAAVVSGAVDDGAFVALAAEVETAEVGVRFGSGEDFVGGFVIYFDGGLKHRYPKAFVAVAEQLRQQLQRPLQQQYY